MGGGGGQVESCAVKFSDGIPIFRISAKLELITTVSFISICFKNVMSSSYFQEHYGARGVNKPILCLPIVRCCLSFQQDEFLHHHCQKCQGNYLRVWSGVNIMQNTMLVVREEDGLGGK